MSIKAGIAASVRPALQLVTVVDDSFTGADGAALLGRTATVGGTWVNHPSASVQNLEIRGNRTRSWTGASMATLDASASTDVEASFIMRAYNSSVGGGIGVVFRCDPALTDFYMIRLFTVSGPKMQAEAFRFRDHNQVTVLQLTEIPFLTTDRSVTCSIIGTGASVSVVASVDSVEVINVSDTAAERITIPGRVGVRGIPYWEVDSLLVQEYQ